MAEPQDIELTVCIVIFKPDRPTVLRTLQSLRNALGSLPPLQVKLTIVDNSPGPSDHAWLVAACSDLPCEIISGQGNVGFGRANNLVLGHTGKYHLVLNPDVEMEQDAIKQALSFMRDNAECGLLTPQAFNPDGSKQYLCKRYPTLFDLLLRGFAPSWLKSWFHKRLDRYEMHDQPANSIAWDPPIVSGCFMFFRGDVYTKLKGFDPRYLLYFEDFDVSLRTAEIARIAYVPTVRIVHEGGRAADKGLWHIWQFVRSAGIFFTQHTMKVF